MIITITILIIYIHDCKCAFYVHIYIYIYVILNYMVCIGLYSARRQLSQCCNRSDLDNLCQSLFVDGAHVEVGRWDEQNLTPGGLVIYMGMGQYLLIPFLVG